jgi:hypothetical protein
MEDPPRAYTTASITPRVTGSTLPLSDKSVAHEDMSVRMYLYETRFNQSQRSRCH